MPRDRPRAREGPGGDVARSFSAVRQRWRPPTVKHGDQSADPRDAASPRTVPALEAIHTTPHPPTRPSWRGGTGDGYGSMMVLEPAGELTACRVASPRLALDPLRREDADVSEQLAAGDAEQVRRRDLMAEGDQVRVDAVLEDRGCLIRCSRHRARSQLRSRQPDRRHQVPERQLRQHPRVDLVGLARQRCQPLDPLRDGLWRSGSGRGSLRWGQRRARVRKVNAGVVAYEIGCEQTHGVERAGCFLTAVRARRIRFKRLRGRSELLGPATRSPDLRGRRGFLGHAAHSVCSVVCGVSDFGGGSYEVSV